MNFYGHAVLAAARRPTPGFVLGSMLPDFEGMARTRIREVADEEIRAGIAFHHTTDHAFHSSPTFVAFCAAGVRSLVEVGLHRGSARAVAHVGVELLLDAELLAERAEPLYLEALSVAGPHALGPALAMSEEERASFEHLRGRLVEWGFPVDYARPEFVTERLVRMLERRPRLALDASHAPAIERWLREVVPEVRRERSDWIDAVERAIDARMEVT